MKEFPEKFENIGKKFQTNKFEMVHKIFNMFQFVVKFQVAGSG